MKKGIIIIIAIIALFFLTSSKTVERMENVTETVSKAVVISEPYETTETYDEKIPLGDPVCKPRNMNYTTEFLPKSFAANNSVICSMRLTNNENVSGEWIFDAYLRTDEGRVEVPEIIKEVGPGKSEVFSWTIPFDKEATQLNCIIHVLAQPSMEKCFYPEPVTYMVKKRTRTVTKYRNHTEYKEVEETTEKLVNVSINRFFGYKQPNFGW